MSAYILGLLTIPVGAAVIVAAWALSGFLVEYGLRFTIPLNKHTRRDRRAGWGAMVAMHRNVWGLRVGRRTAIIILPPEGDSKDLQRFHRIRDRVEDALILHEREADR